MSKLNNKQIEKYSRQIIIDSFGISGQKKIIGTKVLIIGCGGLGTSAAQYLSMAGVKYLGSETIAFKVMAERTSKDADGSCLKTPSRDS